MTSPGQQKLPSSLYSIRATAVLVAWGAFLGAGGSTCAADAAAQGNPLARDESAVQAGDELFHERCAVCHGQRAQGGMASNLVQTRTVRRGSEDALFQLIRTGIPGTEMPPQDDLPDERIWQIVSYLRSMALPGQQPPLPGDVVAGEALFRSAGCASCHIVNGAGGFLGPPLDSIAIQKSSEEIRKDVLEPSASLAHGFETIGVETVDGRRIEGILKNEDTFLLLVQTPGGEVRTLRRSEVHSVEVSPESRMPEDYATRLSQRQLTDLLAFLDRQRDPFTPVVRGFSVY